MNGCSCLHGELDFSNQTIIIFRIPKQPDAIHCSTTFFYCGIVTIAVDANVRSSKSGSVNAVLVDSKHMPFLEQAMHGDNNNGVGNSARTLLVNGVHDLL